jgi:hypothetical protein
MKDIEVLLANVNPYRDDRSHWISDLPALRNDSGLVGPGNCSGSPEKADRAIMLLTVWCTQVVAICPARNH